MKLPKKKKSDFGYLETRGEIVCVSV
jgi:hypothetical protein